MRMGSGWNKFGIMPSSGLRASEALTFALYYYKIRLIKAVLGIYHSMKCYTETYR
jgi:hypothetical protein